MSVKERPRKEKKDISKVVDKKDTITKPSEPIQVNKQKIEVVSEQKVVNKLEEFINNLPGWVNKPWMFIQPTHAGHLQSWKESWKTLIIDYSSHFKLHIISIIELQDQFPFNNNKIRKQLTKPQLDIIVNDMVENGLAKWIDDHHIIVRVYYKTNEQWKEIIVAYLFDTGYAAEVLTFYELQNMGEDWSTLPISEFVEIFDTLVEEGRAKWVGSTKDSFKLII